MVPTRKVSTLAIAKKGTGYKLLLLNLPPYLTKGNGTRAITVRLLDAARRGSLASRLRSQLFARGLATSRFTGSLLSAGHA